MVMVIVMVMVMPHISPLSLVYWSQMKLHGKLVYLGLKIMNDCVFCIIFFIRKVDESTTTNSLFVNSETAVLSKF